MGNINLSTLISKKLLPIALPVTESEEEIRLRKLHLDIKEKMRYLVRSSLFADLSGVNFTSQRWCSYLADVHCWLSFSKIDPTAELLAFNPEKAFVLNPDRFLIARLDFRERSFGFNPVTSWPRRKGRPGRRKLIEFKSQNFKFYRAHYRPRRILQQCRFPLLKLKRFRTKVLFRRPKKGKKLRKGAKSMRRRHKLLYKGMNKLVPIIMSFKRHAVRMVVVNMSSTDIAKYRFFVRGLKRKRRRWGIQRKLTAWRRVQHLV